MIRPVLAVLLGLALALTSVTAHAATATPSTSFSKPTTTFTVADQPRVGPYGDVLWTLTPAQSGGSYDPANLSVAGGQLRYRLHGSTGAYAAFDASKKGQTYGTWTTRIKTTGTGVGWGLSVMLWPTSDQFGEGEVDAAEGDLDKKVHTYVHHVGECDAGGWCGVDDGMHADTGKKWAGQTHTVSIRWEPGLLDIKVDGRRTIRTSENVPTTTHRLVLQAGRKDDAKTQPTDLYVGYVRFTEYAG